MSDSTVITMPTGLREFLIAMAVSQELQVQMVVGANHKPSPVRDTDIKVTFRLNEQFKYLEPCLQVIKDLVPVYDYSGWDEYTRKEFDNFVEFDFETAKKVAVANRVHITEAFGIMHGTVLNALFFAMYPQRQPILAPLMLPKRKEGDKIRMGLEAWDSEAAHKFRSYVENNYPEISVSFIPCYTPALDIDLFIKMMNQFDIIIAESSASTYIAAALDKTVIEIFATEEDKYLYNNDNLNLYVRTVGNPTAEGMWYMFEDLWEKFQEHTSITSSQEQTPAV